MLSLTPVSVPVCRTALPLTQKRPVPFRTDLQIHQYVCSEGLDDLRQFRYFDPRMTGLDIKKREHDDNKHQHIDTCMTAGNAGKSNHQGEEPLSFPEDQVPKSQYQKRKEDHSIKDPGFLGICQDIGRKTIGDRQADTDR